jgi:hypothetical protein
VVRTRRDPRERPWWIGLGVVAAAVGVTAAIVESDPLLGLVWAAGGFADIAILLALVELFRLRLAGTR